MRKPGEYVCLNWSGDIKMIREQEREEQAIESLERQRWIPTSERLPDRNDLYLVTVVSFGETAEIRYLVVEQGNSDGTFMHFDMKKPKRKSGEYIIAWMPLPKKYMEETE